MNPVDSRQFTEALDDIEEMLSANEASIVPHEAQVVDRWVRVRLDSRLPNGA
ncbi:MAG: hypothetical protein JW753_09610 [Dehalococcoidia bacterium]|nr:hypothetical protein [Dehalococcoidia bacterium]